MRWVLSLFYNTQDPEDECSFLTNVSSSFWLKNIIQCEELLARVYAERALWLFGGGLLTVTPLYILWKRASGPSRIASEVGAIRELIERKANEEGALFVIRHDIKGPGRSPPVRGRDKDRRFLRSARKAPSPPDDSSARTVSVLR